jgi:predicted nuclease of restriction endonuclease-like RecB superfamily
VVPPWLSDRDRPWLRDLLCEAEAMHGRPFAELQRRWRQRETDPRAGPRLTIARHVLQRLLLCQTKAPRMATIRRELFAAAANVPRDEAVARVAAHHGTTPTALLADLFVDLPHARRLVWPNPPLAPADVLLAANLAIGKGMLVRAEAATLRLEGAARAVLRTAWLHGGAFTIEGEAGDAVHLRWRLPDRRSARALAATVPMLPWAHRYRLTAHCRIGGLAGTFVLATGDPILPGPEPRAFDSELERTFALDAAARAPQWELLREPIPLVTAGQPCFPDFALRHRDTGERWLLEIAGLRDRRALAHKLAALTAVPRYVLCLPRRAVPAEWRGHPRIVPFGRRVEVASVLRAIAVTE